MARTLELAIRHGDITELACDVLALKFSQAFYGVDRAVAQALSQKGTPLDSLRPDVGDYRLVKTHGVIAARYALFVGVVKLQWFGFSEITDFAKRGLAVLCQDLPEAQHLVSTIHGTGYGLDEAEAFLALCQGVFEAMQEGLLPPNLKHIAIVDRDLHRVERLCKTFETRVASQVNAGAATSCHESCGT